MPAMPGTTVSRPRNHRKRRRPISASIWEPKYQNTASVITTQMVTSLASGQVTILHSSPSFTRLGNSTSFSHHSSLSGRSSIDTAHSPTTKIGVVTSRSPARNHGRPR